MAAGHHNIGIARKKCSRWHRSSALTICEVQPVDDNRDNCTFLLIIVTTCTFLLVDVTGCTRLLVHIDRLHNFYWLVSTIRNNCLKKISVGWHPLSTLMVDMLHFSTGWRRWTALFQPVDAWCCWQPKLLHFLPFPVLGTEFKQILSGALAQSVCQALLMLQTRVRIQARVRRINNSFLFFVQCSDLTDV